MRANFPAAPVQNASPPSLKDVTEAYRTAADSKVILHPTVSHSLVRDFMHSYSRLRDERETLIGSSAGKRLLRECSALSFALTHAPLPLNHNSYETLVDQSLMHLCQREAAYGNQALVETLQRLQSVRATVQNCAEAPYLDALSQLTPFKGERMALVVTKLNWVEDVQRFLTDTLPTWPNVSEIPVLASDAGDLTQFCSYRALYIFGAIRSHPEYIYTASRADRIEWLLFDWMRREARPELLLATMGTPQAAATPGEIGKAWRPWWQVKVARDATQYNAEEAIQAEAGLDQLTRANRHISGVAGETATHDAASVGADLLTLVKVLYVRGGYVVYVPNQEDVDCVEASNLRTRDTLSIVKKKGADIDPGDFVIVYSRGSRSFIQTEADRHLGLRARVLRAAQAEWKQALYDQILEQGWSATSRWLMQNGGIHSGEYNLKYWVWEHFIRPQEHQDFEAVFRLIGRLADVDRYWDMMGEIRSAHVSAGRKAHERLEQLVARLDVRRVFADGHVNLSTDPQSGKLTLIQVEAIDPEVGNVHEGQLLKLLE